MNRPPQRFETERLVVRAPQPGDGPAVVDAIAESIGELRPWMPWAQRTPSLAEHEAHLREILARWTAGDDFPMYLVDKVTREFVGGSGLHRFDLSVPRFEIGYWVRSSRVGQGYATEAVRGIAQLAIDSLGARRVEIRCSDRNERSWRVAERAGFELEGILRHEAREADGSLRDTRVYARVR
jgi:RimJ/RimL family protein N-acetyltransferase